MIPVFSTKRLRVYSFETEPTAVQMFPRTVFIGFLCNVDWSGHVVVATVAPFVDTFKAHHVEWIETTVPWRRKGLARELWEAIEKHLGARMVSTPASHDGRRFLKKIDRNLLEIIDRESR